MQFADEMNPDDHTIRETVLSLVAQRGTGRTICPSEVARAVKPDDWRPLMPAVRRVAGLLVAEQRITVTQRGKPVDPEEARGPIRIGLRP